MKTLHLLRHAKSSWKDASLDDRERELNGRGRRDAPAMGAALAAQLAPMPVTVSPAARARLTLQGLCEGWPALAAQPHEVEEELYTFSGARLLAWLRRCSDARDSLFLLGHNPALTELVNTLLGELWLENLPTAGYVRLQLPGNTWRQAGEVPASADMLLVPRELARD